MNIPRTLCVLLLVWPSALHATGTADLPGPTASQVNTFNLVVQSVSEHHYRPRAAANVALLQAYVESLDPDQEFFLDSDLSTAQRRQFSRQVGDGDLGPVFELYSLYRERVARQTQTAWHLLAQGLPPLPAADPGSAGDWAKNLNQLDDRWRDRLAVELSELMARGRTREPAVEILRTRYGKLRDKVFAADSDAVFAAFVNSYLTALDPHSGFFPPRRPAAPAPADLEGIGVQLKPNYRYAAIKRVFAGGAADRSRSVQIGDRILAVGESRRKLPTDVVHWPIEEIVELIRGPRGSLVRLELLPHLKREPHTVYLSRDRIRLEQLRASLQAQTSAAGRRVGMITVPRFYVDYAQFGRGGDYPNTSRDVAKLIGDFEPDDRTCLLVDLRGNRGGELMEAVRLAGLFVGAGPVVQVRNAQGAIEVFRSGREAQLYKGPLVVIVDRNSASASEIFAAAMQDYRRAVIAGERTFGKGTVQQTFDLNRRTLTGPATFGQLVLTTAQYYRVNGNSTQLEGIAPDIELPALLAAAEYSERLEKQPLPWDQVDALDHQMPGPQFDRDALVRRHLQRVASSAVWDAVQKQLPASAVGARLGLPATADPAQVDSHWREEVRRVAANICDDL